MTRTEIADQIAAALNAWSAQTDPTLDQVAAMGGLAEHIDWPATDAAAAAGRLPVYILLDGSEVAWSDVARRWEV